MYFDNKFLELKLYRSLSQAMLVLKLSQIEILKYSAWKNLCAAVCNVLNSPQFKIKLLSALVLTKVSEAKGQHFPSIL